MGTWTQTCFKRSVKYVAAAVYMSSKNLLKSHFSATQNTAKRLVFDLEMSYQKSSTKKINNFLTYFGPEFWPRTAYMRVDVTIARLTARAFH